MKLPAELVSLYNSFLLPGTILLLNIPELKLNHKKFYIIATEVIDGSLYGLLINSAVPEKDKNTILANNYICISKKDYSFLGQGYSFINCNKLIRVSVEEVQSKIDFDIEILSEQLTQEHREEIINKFRKGLPTIEPKLAKAVISSLEKKYS